MAAGDAVEHAADKDHDTLGDGDDVAGDTAGVSKESAAPPWFSAPNSTAASTTPTG
jgi:hypothetical protein